MPVPARLRALADRSTCRLVHHGRKSGKPYEVTIWFVVDGDDVFLATAKASRQWVRNVTVTPAVAIRIDAETFAGTVERLTDPTAERHVTDLMAGKYWYLAPLLWSARLLGFDPKPDASFRLRLD